MLLWLLWYWFCPPIFGYTYLVPLMIFWKEGTHKHPFEATWCKTQMVDDVLVMLMTLFHGGAAYFVQSMLYLRAVINPWDTSIPSNFYSGWWLGSMCPTVPWLMMTKFYGGGTCLAQVLVFLIVVIKSWDTSMLVNFLPCLWSGWVVAAPTWRAVQATKHHPNQVVGITAAKLRQTNQELVLARPSREMCIAPARPDHLVLPGPAILGLAGAPGNKHAP
jgi:hypothetical protein